MTNDIDLIDLPKIILVDNLQANLMALEGLLRCDEMHIFKAKSGAEALELMLHHEFALALIDVQMPHMSGFELAELMRGVQRTKKIPIIFVTANTQSQHLSFRGYENGAIDFLLKPIDTHAVKSKVNIFLELFQHKQEQEKLLLKLKKTQDELEQAVQVRDIFIATLSHELKTPLTAILLWSRLIQKQKFDPEKNQHGLQMIEESAKMQSKLINDLLDINRIQSGNLAIHFTKVSPAEIVRLCIETVYPLAEAKQIKIELQIKIKSEKIWGDAERIKQIVWNLLVNAIKFSYKSGKILVAIDAVTENATKFIGIKVVDFGRGIEESFLPKIFERFSQADSSSTRTHDGLGLGLTIVRDLIHLQAGIVRAESAGLEQGTTLTVLLPQWE
ncbi:MAG: hybrid sensor histidine kinase/response regulator [Bacteriovoracaceae bacterium]|nr:hybrid sensor histidine kinase/response regulator [Bacteriovoracaceae bacterium]